MSRLEIRALRSLIKISFRRQENLDKVRLQANEELIRLSELAQQCTLEVENAAERVMIQTMVIDKMVTSNSRFQVGDYLAHQDHQATLQEKMGLAHDSQTKAETAVSRQKEVLDAARRAADKNLKQRERIQEKLNALLEKINVKNMDDQDEEAEEALASRKRLLKLSEAIEKNTIQND